MNGQASMQVFIKKYAGVPLGPVVVRRLAVLTLLGAAAVVNAADIYRWVDEHGRTHMADTVPERYKHSAKRLDGRKYELSEADKAAAHAARERMRAEQADEKARRSEAEAQKGAQAPAAMSGAKPGRPVEAAGTECDRLWRAYYASQACFGPWRTTDESHARCKETVSPAQQCGPSRFPPPDTPR